MSRNKAKFVAGGAVLLSALAMSQQSNAQSSVTLYGRLDESLQYVHNTGGQSNQLSMQSSQMYISRWGLRGTEDLGGGLNAIFELESQFDLSSGALHNGDGLFDRNAYVGLSDDKYGMLTFGRQFDVLQDIVTPVQGNYYLEYFTAPGDVDLADGSIKISNAVKWQSPSWNGLKLGAMYAFGNVAGSTGSGQFYAGAASYSTVNLTLAAGYIHSDNGNPVESARGTGSGTGLFFTPVNAAYASASSFDIARAGASYQLGTVVFGGYYSFSQYMPDGYSTFRNAERYNNVSLFTMWRATPSWTIEAGYDLLKSHGDSSATYQQGTAATSYALSKLTMVYAEAAYGHASGQNGAGAAQASIADTWPLAGKSDQIITMIGIAHQF